jgi:hypothetical protein
MLSFDRSMEAVQLVASIGDLARERRLPAT